MKKIAVITSVWIAICASIFSFQCKKETLPTVYGKWETFSVVGFKWDYEFEKDGTFCRALPEYFPDTTFCYTFEQRGDTSFISSPEAEQWLWDFEAENIAVITSMTTVQGQPKQFILRRKTE
jgi:hypothetical protein